VNSANSAQLVALDTKTGNLIWEMNFKRRGGEDLAVGIDGVLYVAGISLDNYGRVPTAFAIRDHGDRGEVLWTKLFREQVTAAHWAAGIALFEKDAAVQHVYVSTTNARGNAGRGGKLHRLDPATGSINATFDPNKAEPRGSGGLTDITLGNDGLVYVGARGYEGGLIVRGVPARMYALVSREGGLEVLWSLPIAGSLDKASPAIGPKGGLYFGSTADLSKIDPLEPHRPKALIEWGAPGESGGPVFYSVKDPR
jgi:outer membrane protein assembly factor BamB